MRIRSSLWLAGCLGLVVIAGAAVLGQGEKGASATKTQASPSPAQRRIEAAREVVDTLNERARGGEPMTPTFLELKASWEERLLDAELAAATTEQAKRAALNAYLDASGRQLKWVNSMLDGPPRSMVRSMAEYHVADAECRLAELHE